MSITTCFVRNCRIASLLIAVVLAFPAWGGEAQWVEVRSPNFSVITDAGEKRGRDVAFHFEQMKAVFGALMVKAKVNLPVPLQIMAFRNTKEIRQVAPLWHGKPTEVAGLFQAGQDRCFIMHMSVENPWQVVFHEYAHQLTNGNITAPIDPWFEEGFAEYFSSIEVDNKQARVGKIPEMTYRILMQDGMMHVADLFRVQHNSKAYNESGDHRTVFYAESALVVHYLYDNQLIAKLGEYFTTVVDQKKPVEESMQQAFGMSPAQFDKALHAYLTSGRYRYYALPTPAGITSSGFTSRPVTSLDAAAVIADIHLHSIDYQEKAVAELQEVLKADPNHAAALRGLGYAYLEKRDFAQASEYFRRAAANDSSDPRVHYYIAMLAQNENGFRDPETAAAMTKELETATKLDPEFADAYSMLAFAQMNSGAKDAALQSALKAVTLNPRNEIYRYNAAQICIGAGKLDDAIKILKFLAASGGPEVAARSSQSLQDVERFKQEMQAAGSRAVIVQSGTVPATRLAPDHPSDPQSQGETTARSEVPAEAIQANSSPVKFLKGKLAGVDCSSASAATITVISGAKTWKLHVGDKYHVIVIGADKFSCDWKDQKVAVNYREKSEGEGDLVSLEIQ